ncbi:hypothetical protein GGF46_003291 [Coemansia sp. RSA 552]|nr:hypothetical protein GGF46_003291 [Coemansia sp. RSA 552]
MEASPTFDSKDGRLSVAVDGQIPETLLRLLYGDGTADTGSDVGSDIAQGGMSYGRLMRKSICATSTGGDYMALAYADRFMLLERPQGPPSTNYSLVSVSSDAAAAGETVTALYCMDIYAAGRAQPQTNQSLCVLAGYSSGHLRIFSQLGHLLTSHQFHPQSLLHIRHRMPAAQLAPEGDSEEVCLTYVDGTMVNIDGRSLYLALRLCLNEAMSEDELEGLAFQYKKWAFDLNIPCVSDAVSYGPPAFKDPLASLAKSSYTSSPLLSDATARFLVAPYHGDAAFGVFVTNEDAAMSFSAVDIAGKMAARVTGAVLNIAKSYLWRRGSPLSGSSESAGAGSSPKRTEPGATVPCAFAVRDSPRKALSISLAPAQYGLAALTDSLGRVLVFDLANCETTLMLKGLRGSQCAWIETQKDVRRMYVVVYATKRGILEVYELGSAGRPLASANIGPGWTLVQNPTQPLGGSLLVGSGGGERQAMAPLPASCVLVNEKGQVARVLMK